MIGEDRLKELTTNHVWHVGTNVYIVMKEHVEKNLYDGTFAPKDLFETEREAYVELISRVEKERDEAAQLLSFLVERLVHLRGVLKDGDDTGKFQMYAARKSKS